MKRDLLFLFCIPFLAYWSNGRVPGYSDPVWNTCTAASIAARGTADITPFRGMLQRKFPQYDRWMRAEGEKTFAKYPLLAPLAAAPFFLAGRALGMAEHSWAVPYAGKLAAAFFTALSVVFVFLAARRIARRTVAFTVALVYALCTASFSVSSQALFQHGLSQCLLAASAWVLLVAFENRKVLGVLGAILALLVWARPLDLFFALPIFGYAVVRYRKEARAVLLGALPVVLAAAVVNLWLRGSLLPSWYGGEAAQWDAPLLEGIAAWLVSPGRGLFVYSPVFLFSLAGGVFLWRRGGQGELRALTLGVLLCLLAAAKWHSRGGGYGYRLLADLSVPLSLCMVPVLARLQGRRLLAASFYGLAVVSFLVHAAGAATFFTGPSDVWRLKGGRLHCAFRTKPKLFDALLDSQRDAFEARHAFLLAVADGVNTTLGRIFRALVPVSLTEDVRPWCRAEAIGSEAPPRLPNVILLSIDSLRADHLGCYGYGRDTSPHLDAFARSASLFEDALSQAPWTLPAHASMLTGLYPSAHGVDRSNRRFAGATETLAVWLKREGYYNAAVVSGPFMKRLYGFDRGFHEYDDELALADNPHSVVTSPRILEKAMDFLDRRGERPFFLFLHWWDVHYDYNPPPPYDRYFDPDYTGHLDARDLEHNPAVHAGMDARDLEHLVALYDGEIRFVDDHLGRFLRELRRRKLLRESIVVITADHGDEFFEHGEKGHSHSLYQELLHVPLILRLPGPRRKGERIRRPVGLVDVVPTVLDRVGVPAAGKGIEGRSLLPLVRGKGAWKDRPLWAETRRARKKKAAYRGRTAQAVKIGLLKAVHYEAKGLREERYEYYDLASDPGEQHPLEAEEARRLGFPGVPALISAWIAKERGKAPRHQEATMDSKTLQALRSLGYAGY